MAEELGLEELLGERGAVHRHEGLRGARAVGVDGARDQLLARARLADHQDVRLRARRLPHQLEDARHRRAPPEDVLEAERPLELLPQAQVLLLEPAMAEPALDGHAELLDGEVLRQVVERALLDRLHRGLDGGEGGHEDHGERRVQLVGAAQQLHAVASGHLEVGEHQVGPLRLHERERRRGIRCGEALVADALEDARAALHHVELVVHDQDLARAHAGSARWAPGKVRVKVVPCPG